MMKRKNTPLFAAALLCVVSLAVMIVALIRPTESVKGEFTPPPFDPAAVTGVPDVPDGLGYSELDCKAYRVALCGRPGADGELWLTNPAENTVWLKARVLDEAGNILGETGLLRPGEYVQTVSLEAALKSGTPIVLKIMAYEPESYYSAGAAALNTTIA